MKLCAQDIYDAARPEQSGRLPPPAAAQRDRYLVERAPRGTKCYVLNRDRFQNMIRALEQFVDKA